MTWAARGLRTLGFATQAPAPPSKAHAGPAGGAVGENGWQEGVRAVRRLGVAGQQGDGANVNPRWAGFAGLQQTTVERLLREGCGGVRLTDDGEAVESARCRLDNDMQQRRLAAPVQANARHCRGGECHGVDDRGKNAAEATRALQTMLGVVLQEGGRGSKLETQLQAAIDYSKRRELASDHEWRQYDRVAAADLERPDWPMQGDTPEGRQVARKEFAKRLAAGVVALGSEMRDVMHAWEAAAARERRWRELGETQRMGLRVYMRAWRELADGVPAHAASWEQKWSAAQPVVWRRVEGRRREVVETANGNLKCAARLEFPEGTAERLHADGFPARFALAWMRLVRQPAVRAARARARAAAEARVAERKRPQLERDERRQQRSRARVAAEDGSGDGRARGGDGSGLDVRAELDAEPAGAEADLHQGPVEGAAMECADCDSGMEGTGVNQPAAAADVTRPGNLLHAKPPPGARRRSDRALVLFDVAQARLRAQLGCERWLPGGGGGVDGRGRRVAEPRGDG